MNARADGEGPSVGHTQEPGSEVGSPGSVEAVLVTAPRCHLCEEAKTLLAELEDSYPLRVRQVELASKEGLALSRRFSMGFPPLLLIDGERFGHGRISRRKLVRHLDQRLGRRR
jgi:hypothetical protein